MSYLSVQAFMLFAVVAVCAAGAAFGTLFWRNLLQTRQVAARKRRLVVETLRMAIHGRSLFDLHVENAKGLPVQTGQGYGLAVEAANLMLALEGAGADLEWGGATVHVYFRIASAQHVRFFDFYAHVNAVERRQRTPCLVLPLPAAFGNQQRRAFVRFVPSESMLPEMGLWFGKIVTVPPAESVSLAPSGTQATPLHPSPAHPTKALQWRAVPSVIIRVRDVSAGGIKLLLPLVADNLWESLEAGQLFLMQATLHDAVPKHPVPPRPATKSGGVHANQALAAAHGTSGDAANHEHHGAPHGPVTLAIVGEVLRVSRGVGAGTSDVCLRFRRWAPVVTVMGGHKPAWVVLKDNEGIPMLSTWIMRRQGEQMRHLGGAPGSDDDFEFKLAANGAD